MNLNIPDDYWVGDKCVENEIPWFTPDAIRYLDRHLTETDTVLEIGTGGSTLFFAKRCKNVIAIETDEKWYAKIQALLTEKNINNVTYTLLKSQNQIEDYLISNLDFDVISIDSVYGFYRSRFLKHVLKSKQMSTLILDNYSADCLFHEHHSKSIEEMIALCPGPASKWNGFDFNDEHWIGSGTRILKSDT